MSASPTDAWLVKMRLQETMDDWVRENHPERWPSDRVQLERVPRGERKFDDSRENSSANTGESSDEADTINPSLAC